MKKIEQVSLQAKGGDLSVGGHLGTTAIKDVIERRILGAPEQLRRKFPEVVKTGGVRCVAYRRSNAIVVAFLNKSVLRISNRYEHTPLDVLPGLLPPDRSVFPNSEGAFNFTNCTYVEVVEVDMINTFLIDGGRDASIFIQDLHVDHEFARDRLKYTLPLAYVLLLGEKISGPNILIMLDRLFAYSVREWLNE